MSNMKPGFFSDIQELAEEWEADGAEPIELWCPACEYEAGPLSVLEEVRVEETDTRIQVIFVGRADLLLCERCGRRYVFVTPYTRKMNGSFSSDEPS